MPAMGVAVAIGLAAGVALPVTTATAEPRVAAEYRVVRRGLTAAQTTALGEAFGLRLTRAADGSVRFNHPTKFNAVPTVRLPSVDGRDEDGNPTVASAIDFDALARLTVLPRSEAVAIVQSKLKSVDLLPVNATPVADNTRFQFVDARGRGIINQPIDTSVSFAWKLGGLPLLGPGADLRVAFTGDGSVTQLSLVSMGLAKSADIAIVDQAGAIGRCQLKYGRAARITKATLGYYAPALSSRATTIGPSYQCEGTTEDATPLSIDWVPAAVNAPPGAPSTEPSRPAAGSRPTEVGPAPLSFGRVDVGSEGTGVCSGLPNTLANLASFNNRMSSSGIPVQFSWGDANAWETDWKDPSKGGGGDDSSWVDFVDMAYWQGHGSPTGFSFSGCSNHNDSKLSNTDAYWGNGDLEWASLFTCLILNDVAGGGYDWAKNWDSAFGGLHQINSFDTVSYHSSDHGVQFANYLLRASPMKVVNAWAQASIDDQPGSVRWASMGVLDQNDNIANIDDYFWGKGPVGPDIEPASIGGYWRLSGMS